MSLGVAIAIVGALVVMLAWQAKMVRRAATAAILGLAAATVSAPAIFQPADVPPHLRFWAPLDLDGPQGFVQRWKLRALQIDPETCLPAVARASLTATPMPDLEETPVCHIRQRLRLSGLGIARVAPVETRCAMAARLYLWERHALQPAAIRLLGSEVARIEHYSSYSCRPIRTSSGTTTRMSEHATANAFDISGFRLADGRHVSVKAHWNAGEDRAAFLRAVRDGLCDWFNVTLGPDYNALHADHFHVDMGLFQTCR